MNSNFRSILTCLCVFATMAAVVVPGLAQTAAKAPKRLLGYYAEWTKNDTPPYSAAQIPYNQLTHIAHAFVLLTAAADGTLEVPTGMIEPALITDAHAAGVKVLLSIGGGGNNQGTLFNEMAASETSRQAFVANVSALLSANGYDGVDIDWEVPNAADKSDCTTLMQELRDALPSPWLISMAVTANPMNYGQGFDIPALAPLVDFFNVMTYDFYGTWSGATGLESPLFQDPADPRQEGSVKTSMDLYENTYAVPTAQLNIGMPFYGYEWDGVDKLWTSCPTCTSSAQNYGPYIKPRINAQGWKNHTDTVAKAPYLTNSTIPGFISYESVSSTTRKVQYVKSRGFGGVFMWQLAGDYDGTSQDLLSAMYKVWK